MALIRAKNYFKHEILVDVQNHDGIFQEKLFNKYVSDIHTHQMVSSRFQDLNHRPIFWC